MGRIGGTLRHPLSVRGQQQMSPSHQISRAKLAFAVGVHCGLIVLVGPFLTLVIGFFDRFATSFSFHIFIAAYCAAMYVLFGFPHNLLLVAAGLLSAPVFHLIHGRVHSRPFRFLIGITLGGLCGPLLKSALSMMFTSSLDEFLLPLSLAGLVVGGMVTLTWDLCDYCFKELTSGVSERTNLVQTSRDASLTPKSP
jgi:hypothetical protein